MRTISIIALKGGVGKTVTAVNLADNLADRGYRVCLVDADPQANSTRFWGCNPDLAGTYEVMCGQVDDYPSVLQTTGRGGLHLLSADLSLFALDAAQLMGGRACKVSALAELRDAIIEDGDFDFVLIDCPPGFTAASIAAIAASDLLIVPTMPDAFAFQGLVSLDHQVEQLRKRCQSQVRMKCLVTRSDKTEAARQGEVLLRKLGFQVYETTIRTSHPIVTESTFQRQPLNEYSKWCSAARDYRAFTDELLETEGLTDGQEV